MKEQKLYVCEFCGTQYKEKSKALECEKNHHTPKTMRQPQYHAAKCSQDGYPDRIEIVFEIPFKPCLIMLLAETMLIFVYDLLDFDRNLSALFHTK